MRECPQINPNPNQSRKAVGCGKPIGKVYYTKPATAARGNVNRVSNEEA